MNKISLLYMAVCIGLVGCGSGGSDNDPAKDIHPTISNPEQVNAMTVDKGHFYCSVNQQKLEHGGTSATLSYLVEKKRNSTVVDDYECTEYGLKKGESIIVTKSAIENFSYSKHYKSTKKNDINGFKIIYPTGLTTPINKDYEKITITYNTERPDVNIKIIQYFDEKSKLYTIKKYESHVNDNSPIGLVEKEEFDKYSDFEKKLELNSAFLNSTEVSDLFYNLLSMIK